MTMNAANAGAANVSAFSLILDGRSDASFPLSFAVVLLLRPSTSVMTPDSPPRDEMITFASEKRTGPKITSGPTMHQTAAPIKTQPPKRAHHSRSSSLVQRPENPANRVTTSRNTMRYSGEAKHT